MSEELRFARLMMKLRTPREPISPDEAAELAEMVDAKLAHPPSTPIHSVDPYAIHLEPGETVVRSGYAVRDAGGRCFDSVGEYTADMRTASLFPCPRAASKERHHYVSGELVHITIIRSPERRELVEMPDFDHVVYEDADGLFDAGNGARTTALAEAQILDRRRIPSGIRLVRIIPGTERAVVRRLVPGPVVEG